MDTTNTQQFRNMGTLISVVVFIGLVILTAYQFHNYRSLVRREISNVSTRLLAENDRLTTLIAERMHKLFVPLYNAINVTLGQKKDVSLFATQLKAFLDENDYIKEVGLVTFNEARLDEIFPVSHDVFRKQDRQISTHTISVQETVMLPWYKRALLQDNYFWGAPFYDAVTKKSFIHWVFPVLEKHNKTHIVFFVLDLTFLEHLILEAYLDPRSYVCFFTADNVQIYHSFPWLRYKHHSIDELVKAMGSDVWQLMGKKGFLDHAGFLTDYSGGSSQLGFISYKTVENVGWRSCVAYQETDIFLAKKNIYYDVLSKLRLSGLLSHASIYRALLRALLSFIVTLLMFFVLLAVAFNRYLKIIYSLVIIAALVLSGFLGFLWFMHESSRSVDPTKVEVYSQSETDYFLQLALPRKSDPTQTIVFKRIPTGFWLEHMHLVQEGVIELGGLVWQRYPKKDAEEMTQGACSFEQAVDEKIQEVFRYTLDDETFIGWRFFSKFRYAPNFRDYPLDKQFVHLQFGSSNIVEPLVCVPDFVHQPKVVHNTIGLAPDIKLANWEIDRAHFSYAIKTVPSFGKNYEQVPELALSIVLKRKYANVLTGILLTLILSYFVLFALLIVASLARDKNVSLVSYVSLGSVLLLATIIPHSALRSALNFTSSYAEKFYFLSYAFIILVLINCILYSQSRGGLFVNYKDNLIVKLLFWPLILFSIVLMTFFSFAV